MVNETGPHESRVENTSHTQITIMILRRLGPQPDVSRCSGGRSCPDIFELTDGDFAVIGQDITAQTSPVLPVDAGCSPTERIVRVPRKTLVLARADIPATL
jgi:hypothetical protein